MTDLAQTVRDTIASRGLSARQLSKQSGVPQERISALLRGKGMASGNLSKLCAALGLELKPTKGETEC